MTRDLKGELGSKKKQKMKELPEEYRVERKGLKTVIEKLKQRMLAKSAKWKDMSEEWNYLDRMRLDRMMCQMQKNAQSYLGFQKRA